MNSLKMSASKKKKLIETGIFTKVSIRKMEKNIRKYIILSSKQIQLEMVSDIEEDNLSKTLSNNIRSKILGKAGTGKSNKTESDQDKIFINHINSNKNYYKQLSRKKSSSLTKLNTEQKYSQKNIMMKNSSKSITNYNNQIKTQINEQNFRKIIITKILYDSFEDNESDNEDEKKGFFLSPNGVFIQTFDFLMSISTLFIVVFNPYYISIMKCFCFPKPFLNNIFEFNRSYKSLFSSLIYLDINIYICL